MITIHYLSVPTCTELQGWLVERVQVLLSSYPSMHTALGICRPSRFLGICRSLSKSLSAIQLNPLLLLLIFLLIYCFPQTLFIISAAAAKSLQSCPTLCDPIDGSLPGSPIPGILQARILEWVAISFSDAWKWKVKVGSPSRVRLSATPWTAAYWATLSMGFSRQEYWSTVPLPSLIHYLSQMKI